jgi:hypothetical protein
MVLQKQDPIKKACLVHCSDELVKEKRKTFQIDGQNVNCTRRSHYCQLSPATLLGVVNSTKYGVWGVKVETSGVLLQHVPYSVEYFST